LTLNEGTDCYPDTSARNYLSTLGNIPEQHRSQVDRGGGLI